MQKQQECRKIVRESEEMVRDPRRALIVMKYRIGATDDHAPAMSDRDYTSVADDTNHQLILCWPCTIYRKRLET
nr:hypothetical protein CFP56_10436 [Quercus suber]